MPITATCGSCGTTYPFAEKFRGRQGKCPQCGGMFKIGDGPADPPPAQQPDSPQFDLTDLANLEQTGAVLPKQPKIALPPEELEATPSPQGTVAITAPRRPSRQLQLLSAGAIYYLERGLVFIGYVVPFGIVLVACLRSPVAPLAVGLWLVGVAIWIWVLAPFTVWGLRIASRLTDFEMPESPRIKAMASLAAVPLTISLVLLLAPPAPVGGNTLNAAIQLGGSALIGLAVGLVVSVGVMWILLQASFPQALAAWFFSTLFFILACFGLRLVLVAIGMICEGILHSAH